MPDPTEFCELCSIALTDQMHQQNSPLAQHNALYKKLCPSCFIKINDHVRKEFADTSLQQSFFTLLIDSMIIMAIKKGKIYQEDFLLMLGTVRTQKADLDHKSWLSNRIRYHLENEEGIEFYLKNSDLYLSETGKLTVLKAVLSICVSHSQLIDKCLPMLLVFANILGIEPDLLKMTVSSFLFRNS